MYHIDHTTELLKAELEDEIISVREILMILRIGVLVVFLVILTFVCIWSKDFRTGSTFSPITGKMETSK